MKNKTLIFFITLFLITGTTLGLCHWKTHQKLGQPGIKAVQIPGQVPMQIQLPETVANFSSTNVPESDVELGYFPKDTSYARRCYQPADGAFPIYATIVMMGADRTSIHRPDYCLGGQGWTINDKSIVNVPIGSADYELPIAKWMLTASGQMSDGSRQTVRGIYIFWFVADGEETPDHYQRLWWLTRDLLSTGVLQRWAYVSYFSVCAPGQEEATFERMKNLIGNSVAQFQYPPRSEKAAEAVKH